MAAKKRDSKAKREAKKKERLRIAAGEQKQEKEVENGDLSTGFFQVDTVTYKWDSKSGKYICTAHWADTEERIVSFENFTLEELRKVFPQFYGLTDNEIEEEMKRIINNISPYEE